MVERLELGALLRVTALVANHVGGAQCVEGLQFALAHPTVLLLATGSSVDLPFIYGLVILLKFQSSRKLIFKV